MPGKKRKIRINQLRERVLRNSNIRLNPFVIYPNWNIRTIPDFNWLLLERYQYIFTDEVWLHKRTFEFIEALLPRRMVHNIARSLFYSRRGAKGCVSLCAGGSDTFSSEKIMSLLQERRAAHSIDLSHEANGHINCTYI